MQHAAAFITQVASLVAWLVILTAIFVPLERFFVLRPRRLRARALRADLAYYFLNGLAPAFLIALPVSLLAIAAQKLTPRAYVELLGELPLSVKILVGVVVSEFGAYWGHRLSHENRFLWGFHKVHHSPESLDWLVNTRAHPVDVVFTRLCGLAPLYLLSLATPRSDGQLLPAIVTVVGTTWSFFVHANLRWRLGPLEWLVATPAFHHWHHTNDEHRDHNYAALLPVLDRLFGTHHLPHSWPTVYGVDEPVAPNLVAQLLDPFGGARRSREAVPNAPASGEL